MRIHPDSALAVRCSVSSCLPKATGAFPIRMHAILGFSTCLVQLASDWPATFAIRSGLVIACGCLVSMCTYGCLFQIKLSSGIGPLSWLCDNLFLKNRILEIFWRSANMLPNYAHALKTKESSQAYADAGGRPLDNEQLRLSRLVEARQQRPFFAPRRGLKLDMPSG